MTIAIIDYGSGNLHSVRKAFELAAAGSNDVAALVTTPEELAQATHIVLPGVGAFGDCVRGLKALGGMWDALHEAVIEQKKPFLGICVGMQMMLNRGLEHGEHEGLGWIGGDVVLLTPTPDSRFPTPLPIPHMGWNELQLTQPHPVLSAIKNGTHMYFVHSYHAQCAHKGDVLATTDYGQPVTACIGRGNLLGVQFHPEKSGAGGLALIEHFIAWDGNL